MILDGRNTTLKDKLAIQKQIFDFAYLLQTNNHLSLINELSDKLLSDYLVNAKFTYLGYNGNKIECNGRVLVYRQNKLSELIYTNSVKLIEGKPLKNSGSNKYPSVRFVDDYCILEFISNGIPIIDEINGWKINIIEINKL